MSRGSAAQNVQAISQALYHESMAKRVNEFSESASFLCYDRCVVTPQRAFTGQESDCLRKCSFQLVSARRLVQQRMEEELKKNGR